jgi:hypothetical protein
MPERISDNWAVVISIDTASRRVAGIWNEPAFQSLVKNDKTVRFPAEDLDPIAPPIDEQEEGPD